MSCTSPFMLPMYSFSPTTATVAAVWPVSSTLPSHVPLAMSMMWRWLSQPATKVWPLAMATDPKTGPSVLNFQINSCDLIDRQ